MTERHGERPDTPVNRPAPVITSKARTASWISGGGVVMNAAGQTGLAPRTEEEPAATITGKGTAAWVYRSTPMENSAERPITAPAPTIMRGHETPRWIYRNGNQANAAERPADQPAPTVMFSERSNKVEWVAKRPAPTIVGSRRSADGMLVGRQLADDSRQDAGGHSGEVGLQSGQLEAVRVTVEEAACLQSVPAGYPWQGSRTAQFRQVGDMIPPLLAVAILGHLLDMAGWQDICRDAYAIDESGSRLVS